jgi:hypothetical protein
MSFFTPNILGPRNRNAKRGMSPEAMEVRGYLCDAVSAEAGDGRARVIHAIHRETGLSERRIIGILRAEVKRLWADEVTAVRDWYQAWGNRRAEQLRHQADLLEARTNARRHT